MVASRDTKNNGNAGVSEASKSSEWTAFLLTTFVLIPGAAVGFVGAFGFAIWMTQLIVGPPGPPG